MKIAFGKGTRTSVGLDIGSFNAKVVELKVDPQAKEVVNFGLEKIGTEVDDEAVQKALKQLLEHTNISSKRVNVSVSGPEVITRFISMPRMKPEELQSAIGFEAEKHIPFKLDEVNLDYHILQEKAPDNKMCILLVAAKKDFIEKRLALIEQAGGLEVQLIDVDSLTLTNSFQQAQGPQAAESEKVVGLLNMGHRLTSVAIIMNGTLRFVRDLQIGGEQMTVQIASTLSLGLEQAQELKANPGDKAEVVVQSVRPTLEKLAEEVSLSFDYFENQFGKGVQEAYLSGGSATMQGLKQHLADSLGLGVEFWDPMKNLSINPSLSQDKLKGLSSSLAVCVGLALRS